MGVVTVTVESTAKRLLAANPNRKMYAILNDSAVDVYIGFDKNVSTSGNTRGIPIAAGGGFWSDEKHKGEVWGIANGIGEVTIVEVSMEEV